MDDAPDFTSTNLGTIVILTPHTEAAREWTFHNLLPGEPGIEEAIGDCLWPVEIDHRFFFDIACGLMADGLTMQDGATGRMATLPENA